MLGIVNYLADLFGKDALKVSHHGYVLENRRIVMHDRSEVLAGNEEVKKLILVSDYAEKY